MLRGFLCGRKEKHKNITKKSHEKKKSKNPLRIMRLHVFFSFYVCIYRGGGGLCGLNEVTFTAALHTYIYVGIIYMCSRIIMYSSC